MHDGLVEVNPHAVPHVSEDWQGTVLLVGIFVEEEIDHGLLLFVQQLGVPEGYPTAGGVEIDVGWLQGVARFGWSVEDGHSAEYAVLGPVPDDVGDAVGVNTVGNIAMVAKQGDRRGVLDPSRPERRFLKLGNSVDVGSSASVHAYIELEEEGSELMHGNRDQFNETNLKGLRSQYRAAVSVDQLAKISKYF
jgi:hypothetical protein